HLPVPVVIDVDVVGVAVHMPAKRGATSRVASAGVVLGRSKATQDTDTGRIDPVLLEVLEHELVLVDQSHIDDDVFGPDVLLIVRQKVLELEVLRELGVLVLGCDFEETPRRIVTPSRSPPPRPRPLPDVVEAKPATSFLGSGPERDDAEIGERLD